jgi:hypothetical protein
MRVTRVTVGDKDKGVGVIEIRMIASDKKILRACLAKIHHCKSESGSEIHQRSIRDLFGKIATPDPQN